MARYLVTGGAGFIGSHLVEALVARGEDVVVLDDLSSGLRANLAPLGDRIRSIVGDVCDAAVVRQAVEGCDVVLHQAALTSVTRSVERPEETFRVNADGTLAVLAAARKAGVHRVVIASSSSVYGDVAAPSKSETLLPAPRSPYAASKLAAEALAQAYSHGLGLPVVSLRYFNVFGPRQRPDSAYAAAIPRFVDALLHGRRPVIYGDGQQTRDFTFVANVVHAVGLAVARGRPGGVYNVASGRRTSVRELAALLAGALGAPPDVEHAPARPGDILHSLADISCARDELGYAPVVGLEEGLERTVAWYRAQAATARPTGRD